MAKAYLLPNVDEWKHREGETFEAHISRQAALLKELCEKGASLPGTLGKLISKPVGDGRALYQVFSEKPLMLHHIPYGDGYHADAIWIRGLRLSDVRKLVARDA